MMRSVGSLALSLDKEAQISIMPLCSGSQLTMLLLTRFKGSRVCLLGVSYLKRVVSNIMKY